jgi:hypothetical protein
MIEDNDKQIYMNVPVVYYIIEWLRGRFHYIFL